MIVILILTEFGDGDLNINWVGKGTWMDVVECKQKRSKYEFKRNNNPLIGQNTNMYVLFACMVTIFMYKVAMN